MRFFLTLFLMFFFTLPLYSIHAMEECDRYIFENEIKAKQKFSESFGLNEIGPIVLINRTEFKDIHYKTISFDKREGELMNPHLPSLPHSRYRPR